MNPLDIREQQQLVVLSALEQKPLAITDLQDRLEEAHHVLGNDEMIRLVAGLEADSCVRTWTIGGGLRAVQITTGGITGITSGGVRRLEELRDRLRFLRPSPTAAETAAEFVARNFPEVMQATMCNAPEVPAEDEPRTMFCITGVAVDAWWHSLPIETKADVMVSYYETVALADAPAPELTAAGDAVVRG